VGRAVVRSIPGFAIQTVMGGVTLINELQLRGKRPRRPGEKRGRVLRLMGVAVGVRVHGVRKGTVGEMAKNSGVRDESRLGMGHAGRSILRVETS